MWDKDRIQAIITRSDLAVERAVLALYRLQTEKEQSTGNTQANNRLGFNSVDAPYLSVLAKQIIANKYQKSNGFRLSQGQRDKARPILLKYWRQLLKIAENKNKQTVVLKTVTV